MIKNIFEKLFIFIFLCGSCNQSKIMNKKIEIIKNSSSLVYDDDMITSQNLSRFFGKDSLFIRKTIKMSDGFSSELRNIIDEIKKTKKKYYSIDLGAYEYAMIFDQDTLYTSRDLGFWRYRNKSILYKSKLVNDIVNNIEFNKLNN